MRFERPLAIEIDTVTPARYAAVPDTLCHCLRNAAISMRSFGIGAYVSLMQFVTSGPAFDPRRDCCEATAMLRCAGLVQLVALVATFCTKRLRYAIRQTK